VRPQVVDAAGATVGAVAQVEPVAHQALYRFR
jgi:hypothetical protein